MIWLSIPFYILYFWLTKILPFFVAMFVGITLLISCFRMGMKAGITVIATIAAVFIALYIINGKEVVYKGIKIFKNIFALSISNEGESKE
jgi:hypothetical protein